MPRILIPVLAAVAAVTLTTTADAAVLPDITGDTLTVTGDGAADQITVRLTAPDTVEVAGFTFSRDTFDRISIRSGGGDDVVRMIGVTEPTTIETGAGADVVTGGPAAEIIAAGDGADLVRTGGADDTALLGAGDDTLLQGPDDATDALEGQTGIDTVRVIGTAESEEFTLQAVGARARITRDVSPATAELAGFETAEVSAGGGPDLVDLGNLDPTDLQTVVADVGVGDGAPDSVAVQGSESVDVAEARVSGEDVSLVGMPGIALRVENATAADRLTLFGLGGSDYLFSIGTLPLGIVLDGGADKDTLFGGSGAEELRGGPGNDNVVGGGGADRASLGDGDDTFLSEGDDIVDGDAGRDTLTLSTTSADEQIDVSAAAGRTRVTTPQSGSLSLSSMDDIGITPGQGSDNVTVRDLTGTGTQRVSVNVMANDSRVDTMTVVGTPAADKLRMANIGGTVHAVTGLGAEAWLVHNAFPAEKVVIDGGEGDDTIDASAAVKDQTQPFLLGGAGKDFLLGSPGQDVIAGGRDNDVAYLSGGLDTFNWVAGDGNDIVQGGAGTDFVNMNGSGANEKFDVIPVGSRVRLTRDIGAVNLDLGEVERIDVNAAGGADTAHVSDVSGTDLDVVTWELAPFRGTTATDGALDRVTVDGSNGNDAIKVAGAGQEVRTTGLAATVVVNRGDKTDVLTIDTKLGADLTSVEPAARNLMTIAVL